jgi:hypothetical protein
LNPMLPHTLSNFGPALAVSDVNNDGLPDLFVGGGQGQPAKLFLQQPDGTFLEARVPVFDQHRDYEDIDALFFDATGNGLEDLYVVSGGNSDPLNGPGYQDRLYLNDGSGNITLYRETALSAFKNSKSVVKVADINGDGAPDLFIGTFLLPYQYGLPASSYLFINDGQGRFREVSSEMAPELKEIGMVTDAVWLDHDNNGKMVLLLVGEWMAPTLLENQEGKLQKKNIPEWENLKGWYRSLAVGDFDGNGYLDVVLGNHGLNTRFKADSRRPIKMYVNDFDKNGSLEHIYAQKEEEGHVVFILKHELEKQLPFMRKRYLKYSAYNDQYLEDIFPKEDLENSVLQEANYFASTLLLNRGGDFEIKELPVWAQKSWIYSICINDFNGDGIDDLLLAGNMSGAKPEMGKYDGSFGELLLGKGDGRFEYYPNRYHGLKLEGDIRDVKTLEINGKNVLMVVKNNDKAEFWAY